jgi:hypothetical protein
MTSNRPSQGTATTRRGRSSAAILCHCSSASTSFMLAALRVLHVDPSHAPAGIAWIEERPSLTPHRRPAVTAVRAHPEPQSNRTKNTRRRLRVERPALRL